MTRILVADKLAAEGLDRLRDDSAVEFEVKIGMSPSEIAETIGAFDGMIIRSGVKITADCLTHPGKLKAIARAGVGVDNVDLDAATAAGVLVMNTPDANTVSTAEHTMAMLLSLLRHIPDAHAHVRAGEWNRSGFVGSQLAGKTLAVVGLGRVGRAVAERALAFGMRVIAFDPFIGAETVFDGAVRVVSDLDDLLAEADCITLHAKVTDETRHMIGVERLGRMKPTAVLVNCARGELVDEAALADALNEERIAGAAIDVYSQEPPVGSPLLEAKNVVLTPHLGASTREAQLAVSLEAVDALIDYLVRGEIRSAVNVVGLPSHFSELDRAHLDLCGRMAAILSPLCAGGIDRLCLTTYGERIGHLAPTLARQCIADLLGPHIDARINLVNADSVARERGIKIEATAHDSATDHANPVNVTIHTHDGVHQVRGIVFADGRPRILAIDGYPMEMVPEKSLVMIVNDDRPGVIGMVGRVFGEHDINIADMTLSRRDKTALMLLKLDAAPSASVVETLNAADEIISVRTVSLPPVVERS